MMEDQTAAMRKITDGAARSTRTRKIAAVAIAMAAVAGTAVGTTMYFNSTSNGASQDTASDVNSASSSSNVIDKNHNGRAPQRLDLPFSTEDITFDSLVPRSGPIRGNHPVTITGRFGCLADADDDGELRVFFGEHEAKVLAARNTQIVVEAPTVEAEARDVQISAYMEYKDGAQATCSSVLNDISTKVSKAKTYSFTKRADSPFVHGVTAGDPLQDASIIWTRVTLSGEDAAAETVSVGYAVSTSADMSNIVTEGVVRTGPARDYTVKVDATGLEPNTEYFYQFFAQNEGEVFESPVGRTKTLPEVGADLANWRFAMVSCASYPHGFFNSYARLAERDDLDMLLHLGDAVYEYQGDSYGSSAALNQGRYPMPDREIVTIEDYRTRWAIYREDPDFQAVSAIAPWVMTWDDHETTNNSWDDDEQGPSGGAQNHQEASECQEFNLPDGTLDCTWESRKLAAVQAYFEWTPIRDAGNVNPDPAVGYNDPQIWRAFSIGDLIELIVLDTRIGGREEQAAGAKDDAGRNMISDVQEEFLFDRLREAQNPTDSTAPRKWKVIAQQVQMMQFHLTPEIAADDNTVLVPGTDFNDDIWDGYGDARQRIYDFIDSEGIENVVVLTGDIHSAWGAELVQNSGYPAYFTSKKYGVEYVVGSVTSPGFGETAIAAGVGLMVADPHIKFTDLDQHGYAVLDITAERAQNEWYAVPNIYDRSNTNQCVSGVWASFAGSNTLTNQLFQASGSGAGILPCTLEALPLPPDCGAFADCSALSVLSLPIGATRVSDGEQLIEGKAQVEPKDVLELSFGASCLFDADEGNQKLQVNVFGTPATILSRDAEKGVVTVEIQEPIRDPTRHLVAYKTFKKVDMDEEADRTNACFEVAYASL